jgi:general L-amino acid transport system permease protein
MAVATYHRTDEHPAAYVRSAAVDAMPPPAATTGLLGWLRANLFSSIPNAILTIATFAFLLWFIPPIIEFMLIDAVWSGADRDACLVTEQRPEVGACWAFVRDRFAYFVYGSYPIAERWRVNIFFVMLAVGVVWLLWLRAPRRDLAAAYFFLLFPVTAFFLLAGGGLAGFGTLFVTGIVASIVDFFLGTGGALLAYAADPPVMSPPLLESIVSSVAWVLGMALGYFGIALSWIAWPLQYLSETIRSARSPFLTDFAITTAIAVGLAFWLGGGMAKYGARNAATVLGALAIFACFVLGFGIYDEGLPKVDTVYWGGMLVTIVVSVVGIVVSLPVGIVLALGRRSKMPAVRLLSVIFIEFVRGVPLITVLFMASVMLPLFVPDAYSPNKLLRALIGIAMFAAAYMAEVVRAGLQAIPKGQYEGAMAVGLSYSQMMRLIILPQALRITIPNIVNSYIALFKDTTLVFIVGIFDLIKTIEAARIDPQWATPVTSPTGYAFAAVFYFIFCYSMSRYARGVEARLARAERR